MKRDLFFDFDGTIVNTISKICDLYNEDYAYYDGFKIANHLEVNRWDMSDECPLMTQEVLDNYFCQPRFFDGLEFMDNAEEVLNLLHNEGYKIYVPTMGAAPNLRLKQEWIRQKIPFVNLIGIDFKDYSNKSHIDMGNGFMFDDNSKYLESTNAKHKIIFGDVYSWNEDSKRDRCFNWYDVERLVNYYQSNS